MHVDIRFGNKEHFGELQKKVYSRVVTPQNQFCFFPILYKLLFGCYSDHAVREFSIQIEIFVDMISCFMPLPVYCYFSQNKPVFFSLQKNKLNNINYVFQTGTENKNFTQLCISAKV